MAAALDFDFDALHLPRTTIVGACARTAIIDGMVRAACAAEPQLLLINIGEGLDNRFGRVDNGAITCIDLDLPEVVRIRSRILPEIPRRRLLGRSVLDTGWMEKIGAFRTVLLVAEGVFMYLPEADVRFLFAQLAERFPGMELIFDSVMPAMVKAGARFELGRRLEARYLWGIRHAKEVESWGPGYRLIERRSVLETYGPRFGPGVRLVSKILPVIRWAHSINKVRLGTIGKFR
jgi:O-methyltransferase involved in polyketide biosynthesis